MEIHNDTLVSRRKRRMQKKNKVSVYATASVVLTAPFISITGSLVTNGQLVLASETNVSSVTGVKLSSNMANKEIATLSVTLNQEKAKNDYVSAVKSLRGQAYNKNLPFNGVPLQTYLKNKGIATKDAYVNGFEWDQSLERIAIQRTVETVVQSNHKMAHKRVDNVEGFSSATVNGVTPSSENIAWGGSTTAQAVLFHWYQAEFNDEPSEESELKASNGVRNSKNGHLHTLLDPDYIYHGASFVEQGLYGSTVVAMYGTSRMAASHQASGTGLSGKYIIEYARPKSNVSTPQPDTNKPNTDTNTPQPDTNKPNTDTNTPQPGTNKPNIDSSTPQPDTNKPNTDTNTPQPDTNKPNTDTNTPQPDTNKPNTDSSTPQPDTNKPNTDTNTPQPDTNKPNTDSSTPQPDTNKPNTDSSTPQPDTNKPNTDGNTSGKNQEKGYAIVSGNYKQVLAGQTYTVTADIPFEAFKEVRVDNQVIDKNLYTAKSGSTVVTLSSKLTNTLSTGKHTLTIIAADGQATGHFVVTRKNQFKRGSGVVTNTVTTDTQKNTHEEPKKILPKTTAVSTKSSVSFVHYVSVALSALGLSSLVASVKNRVKK